MKWIKNKLLIAKLQIELENLLFCITVLKNNKIKDCITEIHHARCTMKAINKLRTL